MGFTCTVGVGGTLSETYNIESGANNSPDRVCRGAGLVKALESSIGTEISFELTGPDGQKLPAGSGKMVKQAQTDAGMATISQTTDDGKEQTRSVSTNAAQGLKTQLRKDATMVSP